MSSSAVAPAHQTPRDKKERRAELHTEIPSFALWLSMLYLSQGSGDRTQTQKDATGSRFLLTTAHAAKGPRWLCPKGKRGAQAGLSQSWLGPGPVAEPGPQRPLGGYL